MRISHLILMVFGSSIVMAVAREPFGQVLLVMLLIGLGSVSLATTAAMHLFRTVGAFGDADRPGDRAWAVAATLGVLSGAALAMAAVVLVGGTLLKYVIQ